jgi:predicted CopG family antitoxin
MKRTQIYIDEEVYDFLEKEGTLENKSVSELIRESLSEMMKQKTNDIIKQSDKIFGLWKDKELDVIGYIDDIRKDRIIC